MKSSKNSPVRRTCRNLLVSSFLSLLMVAAQGAQAQTIASVPVYVQLNAVQLDQLVAPIALDPDPLVAQILTATTFPDQVNDASSWLNQNLNLSPDQRANQANNMSWDASVKGLIAFPAVLDTLAKNTAWTTQLGNAYFNQPGDVMNAIQAMRLQAQQASVLVTTIHERVEFVNGVIEILPVDTAVVYVPYYNPWRIWGTLFVAYPGYVVLPPPAGVVLTSAVAFEPAINVGVFANFGWGFSAWSPAWSSGVVECNHMAYVSHSNTVINHGHFGGHDVGAFEHGGRGVPGGYRAAAHAGMAHSVASRAALQHAAFRNPGSNRPNNRPGTAHDNVARRTGSSLTHSGPTARPNSAQHNASNIRNSSFGHPNSRPTTTTRPGMSNHPSPTHSASPTRPSTRSLGAGRTGSSVGRSTGTNRSVGQNRSIGGGRSMGSTTNRSMGTNRSFSGSRPAAAPGAGRSFGAGSNRSIGAGRSVGSNRPMSRPASATRSFGGGQSSFGGNRSMGGGRPASIGRSGGAPAAGGRRR
jgi:hypothetical protein